MKFTIDNNYIIFSIENNDSALLRRFLEAKTKALWEEIKIITELER